MEARQIIIYAMPYRMTNDKTGEVENEGLTVFTYDKLDFDPCEKPKGSFTARGRKPSKFNCPYELKDKIKEVPGVYDMEMEVESNKDMKAQLTITDLDFVATIKTEIIKTQPQVVATGK